MKRKILEYFSDAKAVVLEAPVRELPGLGRDQRRLRLGFRVCSSGPAGARWHPRFFIKTPALSSNDLGRRAGFRSCVLSAGGRGVQARTRGATYGRRGLPAAGSGTVGTRMRSAELFLDPHKAARASAKCSDRNRSLRSSCNAQPLRRWSRTLALADRLFQQLCQGDLSRSQVIVAYRCLHNLCQDHWAVESMPPLNSI